MSQLFVIAVIALFIYYEWELVLAAITPIIDIIVCIIFILAVLLVLVCEIGLIIIAPIAMIFGIDSREWHIQIARKLTLLKGKKDES